MVQLSASCHRLHARESQLEVTDQIVGVLEADVETQTGSRHAPLGCGARRCRVERQDQAFEAAETRADAKMLESIDEGGDRRFGKRLERDGEQPRGTGE